MFNFGIIDRQISEHGNWKLKMDNRKGQFIDIPDMWYLWLDCYYSPETHGYWRLRW